MSAFALFLLAVVPQTPYPALTDNHREVPNFNIEPVRGMAMANNGTSLFALNTHASQYVRQDGLASAAPEQTVQTILNPVAIALWRSPAATTSDEDRVLVVGGGTHALAMHDRATGEIRDVLMLDSEPADIVVVPSSNFAFVACQGDNTVQRINLSTWQVVRTYPFESQRPRFLYYDATTSRVYVTSFLSGNGSVPSDKIPAIVGEARIYDSHNLPFPPPIPPALCELPDEDVFWLDATGVNLNVNVAKSQVGTLVTAIGRNPHSAGGGKFWTLNVDSKNQFTHGESEPAIRGNFVENRVFLSTFPLVAPHASDSHKVLSWAGTDPTAFGFPFGLAFDSAGSSTQCAFISTPLSDRVAVCDDAGNVTNAVGTGAGSIPLSLLVSGSNLYVHCWGDNKVRAYPLPGLTTPVILDVGYDPTPAPIKEGRAIWYDGDRSAGGRSSCNSCHPGGKADFLGWQISDKPTDFKDVMVTQSLLGIEDTFPYHWRGERALIDFNGAFVDLLGGSAKLLTTPPNNEFEKFQAFVFSLQNPANPRQELSRQVERTEEKVIVGAPGSDQETVVGDAVAGLNAYTSVIGLNEMACIECHIAQTGSMNDFTSESPSLTPSVNTLEVPHLRELRHKDQTLFRGAHPICDAIPGFARSGFGVAHSGIEAGILEFLDNRQGEFNLSNQEVADVMSFVRRFDQGIAPAAHFAVLIDPGLTNESLLTGTLVDQATDPLKHWIDVVAVGRYRHSSTGPTVYGQLKLVDPGSVPTISSMQFECSTQATTVPYTQLRADIASGVARLVFIGVPHGSGHRFALDRDNDDLLDFAEIAAGTDSWDPDSDNDNDPDGHEFHNPGNPLNASVQASDTSDPTAYHNFDFETATLAKYEVIANEPVRLDYSILDQWANVTTGSNPVFARSHTLVMQGLTPSSISSTALPAGLTSSHQVTYTITDLAGHSTTIYPTNVIADPMIHPTFPSGTVGAADSPLILQNLTVTPTVTSAGGTNWNLQLSVRAIVKQRFHTYGTPVSLAVDGRAVIFQVVEEDPVNPNKFLPSPNATPVGPGVLLPQLDTWDTPSSTGTTLVTMTGKFIRAPDTVSAAPGVVGVTIDVPNLQAGVKVRLRLVAIATSAGFGSGGIERFEAASLHQFQFPPTKGENRVYEYP